MLVTSLCWWLYDGDWFKMLVTESLCWWLFSLCWWFSLCIKSVTNILNRSPTSQSCHQHIWSPTSVTNIDVTIDMGVTVLILFLQATIIKQKVCETKPQEAYTVKGGYMRLYHWLTHMRETTSGATSEQPVPPEIKAIPPDRLISACLIQHFPISFRYGRHPC